MSSNAYYVGQPIVQTQMNYGGGNFQNLNLPVTMSPTYNVYQGVPQQQIAPQPVFQQQPVGQAYYPQTMFAGDLYNYGNIFANSLFNNVAAPYPYYPQASSPVVMPQPQQNSNNDSSMMMLMMLLMNLFQGQSNNNVNSQQCLCPPQSPFFPPPPPLDPVTMQATSKNAQVFDDPHFLDFEGGRYDVMGQSGHTYNIMSDKNLQFNARFIALGNQKDATVIGSTGIKVGTAQSGISQFKFSNGGKAPEFNGNAMKKGEKVTFDTGLFDKDNRPIQGNAVWDGTKFTVNTGEYEIKLINKGSHLNQVVSVTELGVLSDGVQTHGLLGQTADFDGKARKGKTGKGAQGEGAIDGVYTDYEVKDLFDDSFKFNRFGSSSKVDRKFGFGAGKAAAAA